MPTVTATAAAAPRPLKSRATKRLAWQGITLDTPENWDLTGFSGTADEGYFRADDGSELGCELKWATIKAKAKPPDVSVRAEAFLAGLKQAAKKKKLPFEGKLVDNPRWAERPERTVAGFSWSGDRKATGAVWYCAQTRRVVIAQVLGPISGRGGFSSVSESVLRSVENIDAEPGWRQWSLYDLDVAVPSDFALVSQQLMNVYLRLSFAKATHRLSVEQWSAANVARKSAFLDTWLEANARGELQHARARADEAERHTHPAVRLYGGPAIGQPWVQVAREVFSLRWPATRFSGIGWQCDTSNKLYLVQALRPRRDADLVESVAARLRCHPLSPEAIV